MMKNLKNIYLASCIALGVAGCGGGGGESSTAIAGAKIITIDRERDILHGQTAYIKVNIRETQKVAAATTSASWGFRVHGAPNQHTATKQDTNTLNVTNRNTSQEIVNAEIIVTDANNNKLTSFKERV